MQEEISGGCRKICRGRRRGAKEYKKTKSFKQKSFLEWSNMGEGANEPPPHTHGYLYIAILIQVNTKPSLVVANRASYPWTVKPRGSGYEKHR